MEAEGLLHRVLVSQDAGWYHVGQPHGRAFPTYETAFTEFIPKIRAAGFTEENVHTLFIDALPKPFRSLFERKRCEARGEVGFRFKSHE